MSDQVKQIHQLIEKAATAEDPRDAMAFSQAACNAANALRCVQDYVQIASRR